MFLLFVHFLRHLLPFINTSIIIYKIISYLFIAYSSEKIQKLLNLALEWCQVFYFFRIFNLVGISALVRRFIFAYIIGYAWISLLVIFTQIFLKFTLNRSFKLNSTSTPKPQIDKNC